MTEGERKLWFLLRKKKLSGFRFRRQAAIGPYIADFFCPKTKLIVELDGDPHADEEQVYKDAARTRWLEVHGCRVIRFWNVDVLKYPNEVLESIYGALTRPPSGPPGHLPPQGGKARSLSLAALALSLAFTCAVPSRPASAAPVAIGASRIPLYSFRPNDTRAGSLTYRGGLYLTSNDADFGGLSDLAVSAGGDRMLAVSDRGRWFRARLSYDERGDLAGLSDGDLTPMLVEFGEPKRNRQRDAEGLALERDGDLDGPVIVSFEQNQRVLRYDFSKGPETLPIPVAIGPWVSTLINNRQLEALTLLSPNSLLLLGESKSPGSSDHIGAIEAYPGTSMPVSKVLSVASHAPFDITSAAKAPGGGIFMLERRFSFLGGLGAQVRFVPEHEISEGARLQGEVLMNLSFQDANIDNMEGVAVRRGKNGETLLYLVSDNNFSRFQRTLLLMFEWKR